MLSIIQPNLDEGVKTRLIPEITHLINEAYAWSESQMFLPGYTRTQESEVKALIEANRLLLGYLGNELAGAVKVGIKSPEIATFGMLAIGNSHLGKGLGSQFVDASEKWALEQGRSTMEIEILRTYAISMEHKDRLKSWYTKLGYVYEREFPIDEMYPRVIPWLKYPGIIQVYGKPLHHKT